jgi:large subunit ribosomal protein L23
MSGSENRTAYDIILRPVVTERATDLQALAAPQYIFQVHPSANKIEVGRAIEQLFNVKVKAVNTLLRKGKLKRTRGHLGRRALVKRAIVTLEPGQKIDLI